MIANYRMIAQGSVDAQAQVSSLIDSLTDAEYAEPSRLPGWSRAHVVAHLIGNTHAQTRQVDYALRGEQIEVYTGGQQTRNGDIERRSALAPADLRAELREAHFAWAHAAAQVDEQVAAAPVAYRDGTVVDVLAGRWIESLVHAVDLGIATYTCRNWPADFSTVLLGYLLQRLPAGQQVRLEATDAAYDETVGAGLGAGLGTGDAVHLRGPIAALAGWLADRGPASDVESLGAALGELGPYPRGSLPR